MTKNILKVLLVIVGTYFLATLISILLSKIFIFVGISKVNATLTAMLLSFLFYALIFIAIFSQKNFRKSMEDIHTWSGLILGWFLFFIFVTGSLGYFNKEIDNLMEPKLSFHASEYSNEFLINKAQEHLQKEAPDSKKWQIFLPTLREDRLKIRYQTPSRQNLTSLNFNHHHPHITKIIDPSSENSYEPRADGGGEVLYQMHYLLHYLPRKTAFIVVGLISMTMFIAIISGIIIHINIFKDYFSFRKDKNIRSWMDMHVLSGVIALPFHLMITYSGLVFFIFLYLPLIPLANYEDGAMALKKETFVAPKSIYYQNEPMPLYSIFKIYKKSKEYFDEDIKLITIVHPQDSSAIVQIRREDSSISSNVAQDKLCFNGVSGELIDKTILNKPTAYKARKFIIDLHRARFADPTLRWLFFFSGVLGTVMIATGLILWTKKREFKSRSTLMFRLINSLNIGTIIGLPLAIASYFLVNRLLMQEMALQQEIEVNTLFSVWFLCILFAYILNSIKAWYILSFLSAFIFFLVPLTSYFLLGQSFLSMGIDTSLIFTSLVFLFIGYKAHKRSSL